MIRIRVFTLVTALALTGACGGEAKTTEPPMSGSSATGSPSATAAVAEIRVTVKGGKVSPRPSVHQVALGRTVRIFVTSDRDDQIHVHGYDKEAKVVAGIPTTIQFTADQSGRFEVETHQANLQLFQLQVS